MNRVDSIFRNIKSTVFTQIPLFLISFIVRRVFVHTLGENYLGLSGLFTNILSVLSVAELGFGVSITFSLYCPLAEGDHEKVKSLMRLFRIAYTAIGSFIIVAGIALTPFLEHFVKEIPEGIDYIPLIYVLHVLDSGVSYFFSYKASLLFADQKKYVETFIRTYVKIACNIVQLVLLLAFHSYLMYAVCLVVTSLVTNLWISAAADKRYPYLKEKDVLPLQKSDLTVIRRNVGAMIFHRFGSVAVFGTDNILMAKLISLASVGVYSNYVMITDALHRVTNRLYQDIMASMGNLHAVETPERRLRAFENQHFLAAWLFGFCSICLFCLYNPFISLWLGREHLFRQRTVAVIVASFYLSAMRKPVTNTKEVMGLFRQDRFAPFAEVALNLVISIALSRPLGIAGILLGTVFSTVLIPFWLQPVILYRKGLERSPASYFERFGVYTAVTVATGAATWALCCLIPEGLWGFVGRAAACLVVPNAVYYLVYRRTEEFLYLRYVAARMANKIRNKLKRGAP